MTSAVKGVFVDTNVLVFASLEHLPEHVFAVEEISTLIRQGTEIWVSPQVLREFIAVLTKPNMYSNPPPRDVVLSQARLMAQKFNVATEDASSIAQLTKLLNVSQHKGRGVHDCNIVATMFANGLDTILTDNQRNFSDFRPRLDVKALR